MLMTDVDDEQGSWNTSELCDTTQHFFHLLLIAGKRQALFLGDIVESTVVQHFVDALHFLHALTNRVEVSEHTTQPTFCNEWHVHTLRTLCSDLFRLLLGTNEH